MVLTQSQEKIASDTHRFRVVNCGRRFGKATLAIEEIKGIALSKEARIAYIAPTIQQARDIAYQMMLKEFKPIIIRAVESPSREITVKNLMGTTTLIQLRGWESIETLRGQAFDMLVIDEVASMKNFWENWNEVLRPTLTDKKGSAMFISTPQGFNHFYDLCNQELTDKDYKTFHFTSYDNPYLPVEELDTAKRTLPPEAFLQEYMASFQKTQGLVYKEFNREKHLYEELPKKDYQKFGSVDFGFRHPAAVLDIRTDGENIYVEDEWCKTERTDIQIADYVAIQKFKAVYPDPENQGAIEELRRKGVNVREVVKGKGSVLSGIQSVRELLIRGNLKINKKCVNLISEFEMYSYDEDGQKKNENPVKEHDDALDSLRYFVSSYLPIIQRQEARRNMVINYKPPKPNQAR